MQIITCCVGTINKHMAIERRGASFVAFVARLSQVELAGRTSGALPLCPTLWHIYRIWCDWQHQCASLLVLPLHMSVDEVAGW